MSETKICSLSSTLEELQRVAEKVVDLIAKEKIHGKEMSYSNAVQVLETARYQLGERKII